MKMASPGFELLYGSIKNQIRSDQDALIAVLHWNLISNGLKCIGNGEEKIIGKTEKESETLPEGWNASNNFYALRYVCGTKKNVVYVFKVIQIENDLLIHLMECGTAKVVSMNIRTSDYATGNLESHDVAFRREDELKTLFKTEIIDALFHPTDKPSSTNQQSSRSSEQQQRPRLEDDDPLRIPPRQGHRPHPNRYEPDDPFSIGRGDLDPFSSGHGGGMIFDPMRGGVPGLRPDPSAGLPNRLPPGAVPPGARFDPFGPPGQRPGPDPDHLPPPGYDDMFM